MRKLLSIAHWNREEGGMMGTREEEEEEEEEEGEEEEEEEVESIGLNIRLKVGGLE